MVSNADNITIAGYALDSMQNNPNISQSLRNRLNNGGLFKANPNIKYCIFNKSCNISAKSASADLVNFLQSNIENIGQYTVNYSNIILGSAEVNLRNTTSGNVVFDGIVCGNPYANISIPSGIYSKSFYRGFCHYHNGGVAYNANSLYNEGIGYIYTSNTNIIIVNISLTFVILSFV